MHEGAANFNNKSMSISSAETLTTQRMIPPGIIYHCRCIYTVLVIKKHRYRISNLYMTRFWNSHYQMGSKTKYGQAKWYENLWDRGKKNARQQQLYLLKLSKIDRNWNLLIHKIQLKRNLKQSYNMLFISSSSLSGMYTDNGRLRCT